MINKRRSDQLNALKRLEQRLGEDHEAAWYAERLERLGQVMFGDLWRDKAEEETKESNEQ